MGEASLLVPPVENLLRDEGGCMPGLYVAIAATF